MINFEAENEGTWFYFDESNHDLGGVCLRDLPVQESERINKRTTKTTKKFKRGQYVNVEEVDHKLASILTWEYCIVDWKGVGMHGKALECTDENKAKLWESRDFQQFVTEHIDAIQDKNTSIETAKAEIEEDRVKNLKTTSPGKQQK